ncbi:mRNA cap guanine-N7 methyltransferase 2 [Diplonema papillatum]|nr:mRNA cap guanine-N7 methyltransferase 2 [Diplonema papillatum]
MSQLPPAGSQASGVMNWTKELLTKKYVEPKSKVVDWATDGNHIGKLVRLGLDGPDRLTVVGKADDVAKAGTVARQRRGDWTVQEVVAEGRGSIPPELKTSDCSVFACYTGDMATTLGKKAFAARFFMDLREVLVDGGVFFTVVHDSSTIFRKGVVENRGVYKTELLTMNVAKVADELNLSLHVKGEGARCENVPVANLTEILRTAELAGFEVLECTNQVELVYTYHSTPPWNELLHGYGVWKHWQKISPIEKGLMELYSTLVLRKKLLPNDRPRAELKAADPFSLPDTADSENSQVPEGPLGGPGADELMDLDVNWG